MSREIEFPAWWWGPFGASPYRRSFAEYVADGMVDPEFGAWLWVLIESGASTIVCAGPSGAGKTTLLTSMSSFVSEQRSPYFARGRYDRFEAIEPADRVILINEISSHLPIYLWGPALDRAHQLSRSGAQLLATAHADDSRELIRQLTAYPNSLARDDLTCWDMVIILRAWVEDRQIRRELVAIDSFSTSKSLEITPLALQDLREHRLEINVPGLRQLALRRGIDESTLDGEIGRRAQSLREAGSVRDESRS